LIFKVKYHKDPDAYGELYDYYVDRIYRFVYFKVNRREEAEDITAEVFLKTWQYIRTLEKRIDNLNALLFRTARNAIIDFYRSKRREDTSLSAADEFKHILAQRDLEREVAVKIDAQGIEACLNQLKDEYREVIILKYIEGFSTSEIATILEKSMSNVRVLLHRGLRRLRELMGE
jgi:RNA polymerase sigma-70 factor (ECF subfamily)